MNRIMANQEQHHVDPACLAEALRRQVILSELKFHIRGGRSRVWNYRLSSLIASGPLTASMTGEAGSPFSSDCAMAFKYFLVWRKNFL